MVCRLPIKRIAITVPPRDWFHGIDRTLCDLYRQALVDLGLAVFDVQVDTFLNPDAARISTLLRELRAFQPEFVFGLCHGYYALICRLQPLRDGWRPNIFTEVLDIPTICSWDHAPMEFGVQLLPLSDPTTSTPGAMETLRRVLTHPRLIHWSRDSGQRQIMQDLGFLRPGHVIQERPPALPGFLPPGTPTSLQDGNQPSVSFVGRFYQEPSDHPHPALSALAGETIRTWIDAPQEPLWHVLDRQIKLMPADLRQFLALDPDQTYFWHFATGLIVYQAQTSSRLKLLGSAAVPVACYGNLRTDMPGVPGNLVPVPSNIPYGPELAATFARHPITIDILKPGFIHGYSHKQIHGFASGGFMLMNRKQDFVDVFGEAGEAVSFVDGDDLGSKVDRFLSDPKYRREVGDAIRERIAARFQLKDVLVRALHAAFQCAETAGSNPNWARPVTTDRHVTTVMNLLPDMRSEPQWLGASVQHGDPGALILTPPHAWQYSAAIRIPLIVSEMNEPHLRVRLIVEAGRMGLSVLLGGTGLPVAEQYISRSAHPVTVTVELPREGATTVLLRNTVETAGRALVLEASLCDRTD